jgi:hypothetical protein
MLMNRIGASILLLVILLAGCRSGKITTIDFSDGKYYGEIDKEGRKDGKGTYRWNDGSSYEGNFKEDDRHGLGIFRWSNLETYKGDYLKDERTGEGVYSWPDGSEYRGSFLNGKRHGQGTFYNSNGSVYKGGWFDDLQHGEGTLSRSDGTTMEGVWQSGKLVTPPSNLPDRASKPKVRSGWKEKAQSKENPVASEFPHRQLIPPQEPTNPTVSPEPAKPVPFVENPANQAPTIAQPNAGNPVTVAQPTNNQPAPEQPATEQPAPVQPVENPVVTQPKTENPSATIKGADDDANVWEGNRMEAELQFVTYLVDGIDTIFHRQTKIPFSGKMRVLDPSGAAIGSLEVLNGRMHGEEVFFDPNGNVSSTQVWSQGKRTR